MSEGRRPVVVIVGGGFGGLSVARGLRAAPVDVVLVDRVNHHLFQPLLYQVATAALSRADIATALRTLLKAQKNATMIMDEVVQVLRAPNRLVLAGGAEQAFDFLVLAPGAGYDFFGHPEWSAHVHVLKSLDDALVIRAKLLAAFETVERRLVAGEPADPPTFAVIGGGPTGVELAGALAEMANTTMAGDFRRLDPTRTRVMLFEAGPRLLSAFPEDFADYAGRALAELGVEVRVGTAVDHIDAMGLRAGGEAYAPAAVLWCAGVRARPAATWLGVPAARNGGAIVDATGLASDGDDTFVIGDAASWKDGDIALPGLAPVAKQQGAYVAKVIRARLSGGRTPPPFRYHDWGNMAVVGRSRAVAVFGRWRLKGVAAWLTWSLVHLMLLIDFRSRVSVYLAWTFAWFTYGRSARLITNEGRDPRSGSSQRDLSGS